MAKAENWKTGCSLCARKQPTAQDFFDYRDAGIEMMELSLSYDLYKEVDFAAAESFARAAGVTLWSLHLPFNHDFTDPAHFDPEVRKNTVQFDTELIKRASQIGIKYMVIHASGEPIEESDREEKMKYSKESLGKLCDAAQQGGSIIAVENLPRTCLGRNSADMLELLESDPRMVACFDTNHLLSESHADFVRRIGSHIKTLHVSDYDFINERHWLPGEGKIDWVELVGLLEEVGYDGPFMFEVSREPEWTINRRLLTRHDFRQNHDAVTGRRVPPLLGTPKDGYLDMQP